MKVIVDDKIPYISEAIGQITDEVVFLPGNSFTRDVVRDADALIIRTRTHCNAELLKGSRVRFIATATIGYDHIDTSFCKEAGIEWSNCPGCNASSVAQYIHSSLLLLQQERGIDLSSLVMGVVGVGHVGTLVCEVANSLGMRTLCSDPPRAQRGEKGFISLAELASKSDIVTFHTPLIRDGKYKTYHLADAHFFDCLKPHAVLINTSRGEVVETQVLLDALDRGRVSDVIIDVWENEPHINKVLLQKTFLGTPHIAGYSADGKANATRMSIESICRFFGINCQPFEILPPPLPEGIDPNDPLSLYDPRRDSDALKNEPEKFEYFRGHYPLRREKN